MSSRAWILAGALSLLSAPNVQAAPCDRAAFEKIVAAASATLTALNQDNNKTFQETLRALKQAKGWTDTDYVAQATPFVADEVTRALDADSKGLLEKVQSFNGAAESADCANIERELQRAMEGVIANTKKKWQHLIEKATAALEGK